MVPVGIGVTAAVLLAATVAPPLSLSLIHI